MPKPPSSLPPFIEILDTIPARDLIPLCRESRLQNTQQYLRPSGWSADAVQILPSIRATLHVQLYIMVGVALKSHRLIRPPFEVLPLAFRDIQTKFDMHVAEAEDSMAFRLG
ncbi:hypothetical protein N7478_006526 [Penicillium angulare]|uniref:uncharacterized protein n=1 Tax=Penicillium angulare TaxID=116970 RepID=UPI00253F68EC|nr:uncharacterized protein N7478_006526 [Penicillium angulare]KAJ5281154.1 hypothetical protein N7478_006526 [Penicillium angulare]